MYRASLWDREGLTHVARQIIPEPGQLHAMFRAQTGSASEWLFRDRADAEKRIADFCRDLISVTNSLSIEDFIFHPKFAYTSAAERLNALYEAGSPFLRLKQNLATAAATSDSWFVKNGRAARCVSELRRRGVTPKFFELADDDRMVVVRTRCGFPAYALAEIETYWADYLACPEIGVAPELGHEEFPELIPSPMLRHEQELIRGFLLLWFAGFITLEEDGYLCRGWKFALGKQRRLIYSRLLEDASLDPLVDVIQQESPGAMKRALSDPAKLEQFINSNPLEGLERRLLRLALSAPVL